MDESLKQEDLSRSRISMITRIRNQPYQALVFFLCILNIALVVVNGGLWLSAAYQKLFVAADFTSFYTGAYMVRVGEGKNLYNPTVQSSFQKQLMQGYQFEGGVLLFPNPPDVAIALTPITLFPLETAFYLWTVLQVGVLVWIVYLFFRLFSHWEKQERLVLLILFLAFWPLTYSLLLGQFSLLMLLALLQVYISMRDSKPVRAGLWMLLMTIKPHSLLIPGMMTLNRRYWRIAVVASAGGILLFVATSLVIGVQTWVGYARTLLSIGSYFEQYGVHPATEFTLRGLLTNLLGNEQGNLTNMIGLMALAAGMIFTWLLWWRGVSQESSRFILYFALTITLSVFLSMHLNPHDALVLVLPAALFYDYLRRGNFPRRAYTFLLLLSPMVFIFTSFTNFELLGFIRLPVLIIIIMLGWMAKYIILERRVGGKAEDSMNTITNLG